MTARARLVLLACAALAATALAARAQIPEAEEPAAVAGPFPWLTLEDLSETRDRPLFSPTRRPPPVAEPEPEPVVVEEPEEDAPPADPPKIRLAGVVLGGTAPVALIEDYDTETLLPFRSGAVIAEWTLATIEPRAIVLRHGDQELRLEIAAEFPDDM